VNEITLQWVQLVKLLILAAFATLYGFGGVSGKWKRRIIAPVVFTLGITGVSLWTESFHWSYLLCALLLYASLSIGYGATFLKDKIIKRSRYGLACAIASLPIFWVQGAWTLLLLHIILCVATVVVAGVWNQTSSARAEESLIGAAIVLAPLFTI